MAENSSNQNLELERGVDITPEDSIVPVYLIPQTEEEIQEREQWDAEDAAKKLEEESVVAAAEAAKESALAKLAKLGLTEEEAKAVIGM